MVKSGIGVGDYRFGAMSENATSGASLLCQIFLYRYSLAVTMFRKEIR